jgi:hypothetical protein
LAALSISTKGSRRMDRMPCRWDTVVMFLVFELVPSVIVRLVPA